MYKVNKEGHFLNGRTFKVVRVDENRHWVLLDIRYGHLWFKEFHLERV